MSDIYTHPEPVTMVPNAYKILERCIEDGVKAGYMRAFKHTDNPTPDMVEDSIVRNVMLEISEWFDFNSLP